MAGGVKGYFNELDTAMNRHSTPVVKWLIYISFAVFLVTLVFPKDVVYWLGSSPSTTVMQGRVWTLVTSAFVHGGLMHIALNLLFVYFMGPRIEQRWGSATFFRFFLVTAIGSDCAELGVAMLRGQMEMFGFGMSGVVFGIFLAWFLYYPEETFYLYFVFPIKIKYLVPLLAVIELFSSVGPQDGVAHLAHLGGIVFAYIFIKRPNYFAWIPASFALPRRKARRPVNRFDDWG